MKRTINLISLLFLIFVISGISYAQNQKLKPIVQEAKYFRKTPPLREMKQIPPGERDRSWKDDVIRNEENPKARQRKADALPQGGDPLHQKTRASRNPDPPLENFDGVDNVNGVYPPDTEGDVGPNHYFQMINLSFAIYDKEGTLLYGPVDNSTLWNDFIGPWTGTNDGDPIVLYDEMADRWIASQFAINTSNGTYWELVAVSETSDPTGSYYQYAFEFPDFNDYPKLAVWPDAYYASFNIFGSYFRVAAAAFERDSMLVGDTNARMVLFDLPMGSDPSSMLPSDLDGTEPPEDSPNYFVYYNDDSWGYPKDQLRIWEFDVDWSDPDNSTFEEIEILNPAAFDSDLCDAYRERCIDQPDVSQRLESLSDRLMYRLQYRNFGSHESMVTNHTVDVDGNGRAGIRWYELRKEDRGWEIHQEGTYSPDADHRWMGSIAMDYYGHMALGYSVSSDTCYPTIRYTGRLKTDSAGKMTFDEETIIDGTGSQWGYACRWGDYSMMAVDPSDSITFWYTQEYLQTSGYAPWKTRIASFRMTPPMPTATAGQDSSICETDTAYQLNGAATYYDSLLWTSSGNGHFDDSTILDPVYYTGNDDIDSGYVDLILTAYAIPPKVDSAKDTVYLKIVNLPEAYAGDDTTTCENDPYQLEGDTLHADSILWSTSGDGSFDDTTKIDPIYTPGDDDIETGYADLTLKAYSIKPCSTDSSHTMVLNIEKLPEADAGNNDINCENEPYQLDGSAENYASTLWTTDGDGTFDDAALLDAVYTPGTEDVENGSVELELQAHPVSPCSDTAFDDMVLTIERKAICNAGDDDTVCVNKSYQLNGSAEYYSSLKWETSGDGTFSNDTIIDPIYTPGSDDIQSGSVELSLSSYPISPCDYTATDELTLTVDPCTGIAEFTGANPKVTIRPNPNTGKFDLIIDSEGCEDLNIIIRDMTGRVLFSEELSDISGHYEKQIDISNQQKGVYLVDVRCDAYTGSQKIVVE